MLTWQTAWGPRSPLLMRVFATRRVAAEKLKVHHFLFLLDRDDAPFAGAELWSIDGKLEPKASPSPWCGARVFRVASCGAKTKGGAFFL